MKKINSTKVCPCCQKEKPAVEYHKRHKNKPGLSHFCKSCQYEKYRAGYKKYSRKHGLKKRYNMTVEKYDELFAKQHGVCAICSKPEKVKNNCGVKRLSVDHNHLTGKVRGLLCSKCNHGLGMFDADTDGINILKSAIVYLL